MKTRDFWRAGLLLALFVGLAVWIAGGDASEVAKADIQSGKRTVAPVMAEVMPEVLRLDRLDRESHRAANPIKKGAPLRFAEAVEVDVTPESHGRWESFEGKARWTMTVEAPGACNLNLGFSQFKLPQSGSLELRAGGELRVRPFTAADNDRHGELWTPVVAGAEMKMVLTVSASDRSAVDLRLASINRGFREVRFAAGYVKIGNSAPFGNCHIDVVCSAAQSGVGPVIDAYRDQIRAGGVYTLGGVDTCSGSAINNTANDGKPLFLTADHCGVRSFNSASMVVYWNHENSTCRTPGTSQNGGDGNGPVNQFNSGAIFRGTYAPSDATIVELDDPLDPSHRVYLAGWSLTGTPSMTASVHFPNTSEKRISFDFDPSRSTNDSSNSSNASGTHWRVGDWEFGSTEGGSSGSPLFDQDGRIVGQLTGGGAACGNNSEDWYGKLSRSWVGDGTSSTRLSTWLDPIGSGVLTLDGYDEDRVQLTVGDAQGVEGNSGTVALQFQVELSEAADQVINLTYSTQSDTATAGSDFVARSDVPLSFAVGQTMKTITISVYGDTTPEENETFKVVIAPVGGAPVTLTKREGIGTINNDDFLPPVVVGPPAVAGEVSHEFIVTVTTLNTPTSFSMSGAPEGMSIDNAGVIRWVPLGDGIFDVTVTATNAAGSGMGTIRFTITPNLLAVAIDTIGGLQLRTGETTSWIRRLSIDSIIGSDRAQSGPVADNETSWLEAEVEGPDYLGFWWKVSSEVGYDFLNLVVDNELRARRSGTGDWEYMVVAIPPGQHTVRWTFAKDESISEGSDAAWIDFVQLASRNRPFLMESDKIRVLDHGPVDFQIPTYEPGAVFTPLSLGSGLSLNAAGQLMGTPTATGTQNFELTLQQDGTTISIPAKVEVHAPSEMGAAANQADLVWDVSGFGQWISQSIESRDGLAAQGLNVGGDGRGELSTYVFGPGKVIFWWRVESEDGYDFLQFEVDGVSRGAITGPNGGWARMEEELSYGGHRLTWVYLKDGDTDVGRDTGWVDLVAFTGYADWAMRAGVGQRTNVVFDHDGDGQNMLFEFATGGSATAWDPMLGPSLVSGSLEWMINKPESALLTYDVEVSGDLTDWNQAERSILQDDATVFRARDGFTTGDTAQRFMRLLVHPEN